MSFWDQVKAGASDAFNSKQGEIGEYLENVVVGTFAKIKEPAKGNQVAAQAPTAAGAAAASTTSSSNVIKYVAIGGALILVAILIARSRGD